MSDLIDRQAAINATLTFLVEYCGAAFDEDMQKMLCERLDALPPAQTELENKIRAIGYTGKEGRIYIGGRLFAVRELPQ